MEISAEHNVNVYKTVEAILNLVSKRDSKAKEMRATMSMLSTVTDHTSRRGASIISNTESRMSQRRGDLSQTKLRQGNKVSRPGIQNKHQEQPREHKNCCIVF